MNIVELNNISEKDLLIEGKDILKNPCNVLFKRVKITNNDFLVYGWENNHEYNCISIKDINENFTEKIRKIYNINFIF